MGVRPAPARRWETCCGSCGRTMETLAEEVAEGVEHIAPRCTIRRLRVILRCACAACGCRRLLVA